MWDFFKVQVATSNMSPMSTREWLQHKIKGNYGQVSTIIYCFIWRARNELIFLNKPWNNQVIIIKIKLTLTEVQWIFPPSSSDAQPKLVRWIPFTAPTVKWNMDGSVHGNPGKAGFDGLIRDFMGQWISGFIGSCSFKPHLWLSFMPSCSGRG